jgi:P2 family phage contractile tail tube protein
MAALENILRNFNLFIDGRGFAGNVEEITLPKLTLKTDEFRGGGMDSPLKIELGLEALEASFTLTKYDPDTLKLFGLAPGNSKPLTFRGSVISEDGTEIPVVINITGFITELDFGSWKAGDKATLKGTVAVRYYKHTVNGEVIHEIDVKNMIRTVNGTDQLKQTRANLGM